MEKAGSNAVELWPRACAGNWGVVDAEDAEANNQGRVDGSRTFLVPTL